MVAIAILAVFCNHHLKHEQEAVRNYVQNGAKFKNYDAAYQSVSHHNSDMAESEKFAFRLMQSHSLASKTLIDIDDVTSKITWVEFLAGFFGTLIWGFGGILGDVYSSPIVCN